MADLLLKSNATLRGLHVEDQKRSRALIMERNGYNVQLELSLIEQLHERDMEASRIGDFETLRSLLSDDAVMMPPGEHWIRGPEALGENYRRMGEAMREVDVVEYKLEFEEVEVLGNYAFEWGLIRGAVRPKGADPSVPVEPSSFKVLRILKKETDGEWRVHRAMWNALPSEEGSEGTHRRKSCEYQSRSRCAERMPSPSPR